MRLEYRPEATWPVQSWLAECFEDRVVVRHGGRVETRAEWFCEAVWDGPFEDGDFDRTDIVAGSGGRLRGGGVTFVPAGSTTDRLQSVALPPGTGALPGRTLVSNSLACLLAVSGVKANPTYRHYRRDIQTVVRGLDRYKRTFEASPVPCLLWYFHNVRWDGRDLREVEKPSPPRDFSAFEPYHAFLADSLREVARNAADPRRRHPIGLMGTLSRGYDSTTVSTLAREVGLRQILTVGRSRTGADDSGEETAKHLGLEAIILRRDRWRDYPLPEVPFLTAGSVADDRVFLDAREHLSGKLLFTGFHGDKVWSKSPYKADSLLPHPQIRRGDTSGLTMTEYRLSAGFIHCPITFWGCRQIHELVRISRDPSMRPWDIPGDYSRPICRRIVESAGVPREAFGTHKRMSTTLEQVLVDQSRLDYQAWCRRHGIEGDLFDRVVRRAIGTLPGKVRRPVRAMFYTRTPTVRDYMFQWAVERQGELYRTSEDDAGARQGTNADDEERGTGRNAEHVRELAGAVA